MHAGTSAGQGGSVVPGQFQNDARKGSTAVHAKTGTKTARRQIFLQAAAPRREKFQADKILVA